MIIRQNQTLAGLPIVFLSNESVIASQLDAMRRGGEVRGIQAVRFGGLGAPRSGARA